MTIPTVPSFDPAQPADVATTSTTAVSVGPGWYVGTAVKLMQLVLGDVVFNPQTIFSFAQTTVVGVALVLAEFPATVAVASLLYSIASFVAWPMLVFAAMTLVYAWVFYWIDWSHDTGELLYTASGYMRWERYIMEIALTMNDAEIGQSWQPPWETGEWPPLDDDSWDHDCGERGAWWLGKWNDWYQQQPAVSGMTHYWLGRGSVGNLNSINLDLPPVIIGGVAVSQTAGACLFIFSNPELVRWFEKEYGVPWSAFKEDHSSSAPWMQPGEPLSYALGTAEQYPDDKLDPWRTWCNVIPPHYPADYPCFQAAMDYITATDAPENEDDLDLWYGEAAIINDTTPSTGRMWVAWNCYENSDGQTPWQIRGEDIWEFPAPDLRVPWHAEVFGATFFDEFTYIGAADAQARWITRESARNYTERKGADWLIGDDNVGDVHANRNAWINEEVARMEAEAEKWNLAKWAIINDKPKGLPQKVAYHNLGGVLD